LLVPSCPSQAAGGGGISSTGGSSTLYLNHVPLDFDEDRLRTEFMQLGPVAYVRILSQPDRRYGFVGFASEAVARSALGVLSERWEGGVGFARGVESGVWSRVPSEASRRLWLRCSDGPSPCFFEGWLRKVFVNYTPLESIQIHNHPERDVACIDFKTVAKAVSAKEKIEARDGWIDAFRLEIRFGQRQTSSHLWLGSLYNVSKPQLLAICSRYGRVLDVNLKVEKHIAFIDFLHEEDSVRAFNDMSGRQIGEKRIVVDFSNVGGKTEDNGPSDWRLARLNAGSSGLQARADLYFRFLSFPPHTDPYPPQLPPQCCVTVTAGGRQAVGA
jgi:RNA recognition motif-containing protein